MVFSVELVRMGSFIRTKLNGRYELYRFLPGTSFLPLIPELESE
jgi:hypothetical protein